MSKILTVICVVITLLTPSLVVVAVHYPSSLIPLGLVAFQKPSIAGYYPTYQESAHAVVTTVASASVYEDEDSDRNKKNEKADSDKEKEKDEKDEDQGQNRLWDSVLLG